MIVKDENDVDEAAETRRIRFDTTKTSDKASRDKTRRETKA